MKRKNLFLTLAVILLLLLGLSACGHDASRPPDLEVPEEYVPTVARTTRAPAQESVEMYSATLYYSDGFGHLLPITQKIAWQEGIAKTVLYQLAENADTSASYAAQGLYATLPENVRIDLDISGGIARVDLFGEDLPQKAEAQRIMTASVVNTLLDFDTVNTVKILVNHEPMTEFSDGSAAPESYSEPVANYEDPENREASSTLYFCNSTGDFLVPIERCGPIHSAETALNQLTRPGEGTGLVSILPENCRVLEVRTQGTSAMVNLSEEFRSFLGNDAALARAYQGIAETIRPYGDFETLEIYVEGELFEWSAQTFAEDPLATINILP